MAHSMNPVKHALYRPLAVAAALVFCLSLCQCSETTAPVPPGVIVILSGNNQYGLRGTLLPEPLAVAVKTSDGAVPQSATVVFTITAGSGVLSKASVPVDAHGRASTSLTLGAAVGSIRVKAAVKEDPSKSVVFQATSSNFYCPEANDTLQVSYGVSGHLFLATPKSSLFSGESGVVEINFGLNKSVSPFQSLASGTTIVPVVWDATFSPRGDYYVARTLFFPEVMKIAPNGTITRFAGLDDISEITENPFGLLVGCDDRGPFVINCGDTLTRYADATYADGVNNDAVAVDPRRQSVNPLGEDVYFIYKPDSTLRRLPLDSLRVEGPVEIAAQLTYDEASFARGMACAADGTVFILVDSNNVKKIFEVSTTGIKTDLFDFFSRGAGTAAGTQNDLAIKGTILYTIDTLNNNLLIYDYSQDQFAEVFADSLDKVGVSDTGSSGERVGLSILK